MQRKKISIQRAPAYPDLGSLIKRQGCRAVGGLAVSGVVSAGGELGEVKGAAPWGDSGESTYYYQIDGDIADTAIYEWQVLLPSGGSQYLCFGESWEWIEYHLEITVDDRALARWLEESSQEALAVADGVLAGYPLQAFRPGEDWSAVEAQLVQALADAFAQSAGSSTHQFDALRLVIDAYQDETKIDGDMPPG